MQVKKKIANNKKLGALHHSLLIDATAPFTINAYLVVFI